MRTLKGFPPTAEQLAILSKNDPGVDIIRGAAGSGKTTTALLRLRALIGLFLNRRRRQDTSDPVRMLVLTYNKTLSGYISVLARDQASESEAIDLEVSTFGRWAREQLELPSIVIDPARKSKIRSLGAGLGLPSSFLLDEVDYVLGRFLPSDLEGYLTIERTGRGASPRMERTLRGQLLDEVINPYRLWLHETGKMDWNDLAVQLTLSKLERTYDVIIVDEAQDFSANQIRAIANQLAQVHSLTFVLDTAQRIYARGFTWREVGILIRPQNVYRLKNNYRNTVEIARFAAPLVEGLALDDDGTIPNFDACVRDGSKPIVVRGRYSSQCAFALRHISDVVDLEAESVAFLHPKGGNWFSTLKSSLESAGIEYVSLTRRSKWPESDDNVALSTIHSAKGLEFDHVIILGLNEEVTPHGAEEGDDQLITLRKLLAMAIDRARRTVVVGYKPDDVSHLISYLDPNTYEEIDL